MKKNKIKYLLIVLIPLLLLILCVLAFLFIRKPESEYENSQNVSLKNNNVTDVIVNEVKLKSGTIEKIDNYYRITMIASNDTDKDINMSYYRISFRDKNDIEIDWFRGTAIGIVKSGEDKNFIIDSTNDLSKVKRIQYEEFPFED